jgi:hypothetical protein
MRLGELKELRRFSQDSVSPLYLNFLDTKWHALLMSLRYI